MDEFELIEKYFVTRGEAAGVRTGIGDDGAVLRPDPGKDLVAVVDTLVENVHWRAGTEPFDIGFRAVAVNLSDIAAMGAEPRWMTLALTLSAADPDWLERFAGGLRAAATQYGVALVGGDTTYGESQVVSVQILGQVTAGRAVERSGARPGDRIYVSGTVGDAAAGLQMLAAGRSNEYLLRRFLRPDARVELGSLLGGLASAAIDLSDGLYADLGKLLSASGVGGSLDLETLPLSAELREHFPPEEQRRLALSGGDDYELCFTLPAGAELPATAVPLTQVGYVVDGDRLECRLDGELVPYNDTGYRHFQ